MSKLYTPVNELIKPLPDGKTFGHAARYCAHLKHLEDLHKSLNKNCYLMFETRIEGAPSSTTDTD